MTESGVSLINYFSIFSICVLAVVYFFLITEKVNKVIVSVLGAVVLILAQVFRTTELTSQEGALKFFSNNLDVLGFVLGMMVLVGIVRESGVFEAVAIWLVKKVKGNPTALLLVIGYLTLVMTTFFSNIPTILILTPVLLVLIKELRLPYLPYFFFMVNMANIGGAMTPISDPTTYYQAKTVGLGFGEVFMNSGLMVLLISIICFIYTYLIFRKQLKEAKVSPEDVSLFKPSEAIKDKKVMRLGVPLLIISVVLMIGKDLIRRNTGIILDNATITIGSSFLAILILNLNPRKVIDEKIDWEILFFFTGLFIIVGSLEVTNVIDQLAMMIVDFTNKQLSPLILLVSSGSASISTFIDNVPYNITMVGAIQEMEKEGITVYPLWWALNLGTSIGGAGSPIAAACNVIAFGQAEKEKMHIEFVKYLKLSFPLVIINSLIVFGVLWIRFIYLAD